MDERLKKINNQEIKSPRPERKRTRLKKELTIKLVGIPRKRLRGEVHPGQRTIQNIRIFEVLDLKAHYIVSELKAQYIPRNY